MRVKPRSSARPYPLLHLLEPLAEKAKHTLSSSVWVACRVLLPIVKPPNSRSRHYSEKNSWKIGNFLRSGGRAFSPSFDARLQQTRDPGFVARSAEDGTGSLICRYLISAWKGSAESESADEKPASQPAKSLVETRSMTQRPAYYGQLTITWNISRFFWWSDGEFAKSVHELPRLLRAAFLVSHCWCRYGLCQEPPRAAPP